MTEDIHGAASANAKPKEMIARLKLIRRQRLIIAIITAMAMVLSMWALYDEEFHYSNTEAGRLTALIDYIPDTSGSSRAMVTDNAQLWETAHQTYGKHLFIFYGSENKENVHGILHLVRGVNGKYRPLEASISPFPYTAGIYTEVLTARGLDRPLIMLAGESLHGIASFRAAYTVYLEGNPEPLEASHTYTAMAVDFLWLLTPADLGKQLGFEEAELASLSVDHIQLLDENGNDITAQYRNYSVDTAWSGGKGTAETEMLYVFMGIVAFLGIVVIRYLLTEY